MKDFFKELNIIDILGIGVPGCLLVLLLGGDQTAELLWMAQFQNHPLAFGIMLIVSGSLAGMLIQELGDMIEKGLWLIPWLDPKVYAVCAVNTQKLNMDELRQNNWPHPHGKTARRLRRLCAAASIAVVICAAVLFPFAMWKAASVTNSSAWVRFPAWLGLFPFAITGFAGSRYRKVLSKKTFGQWKQILTIRNANPYIQTRLVGHGNTSKRTLFDGWRFVMRNLILVLAITNLVSLWKPLDLYRRVAVMMVGQGGSMTWDLFFLTLIASSAICLMLVRYYHYAFLRYKYSLENFMRLDVETTEAKEKEAIK